jgi:predicted dehydrogenase
MPEIDIVLILTPIALNAPLALEAIQAGKHVIMEKPIARSLAEGQTLIDAARQAEKRLFVTEQMAYRPLEDKLIDLITSGEIGGLIMWERVQHSRQDSTFGPMSYASTPWRKQADYPLGSLFDGGIHVIASLTKVFGRPESVTATGRQLRADYGDYDHVVIIHHYGPGVTGMLSFSSTCLPALRNHYHIYGSEGVLTVEFDQITITKADQSEQQITFPAEKPSYHYMWDALTQALQNNHEPVYTPERALQDVALLTAVEQSIRSSQPVRIL